MNAMKIMPKTKLIYSFSPRNKPAERVLVGEPVLFQTEDAFGGQLQTGQKSLEQLDWSKVDGATGPIYFQDADPGDTLIVDILDIRIAEKGVIVAFPKYGLLSKREFKSQINTVDMRDGYVHFDDGVLMKTTPMIGTIGVAPESKGISSSSLGRHGGNTDTKEVTAGT